MSVKCWELRVTLYQDICLMCGIVLKQNYIEKILLETCTVFSFMKHKSTKTVTLIEKNVSL